MLRFITGWNSDDTITVNPVRIKITPFLKALFSTLALFPFCLPASKPCRAEQIPYPIVSDVVVEIKGEGRQNAQLREIAETLILQKTGDTYSPALLEGSLEALKISNRFKDISVGTRMENEEFALIFSLTPFQYIKNIKIRGAFPVRESRILNEMAFYIGDPFIAEELELQPAVLSDMLRKEGFIDPRVSVKAVQDPADGDYTVFVKNVKGAFYSLESLEFQGNAALPDSRLKWKMKTWRASFKGGSAQRFIEDDFSSDIRTLVEFYRKQGYPDTVLDYSVEKNSVHGEVRVLINVQEGLFYKVEIEGNRVVRKQKLKSDLVFYQEGNKFDQGLRKSVRGMQDRYRMSGFDQAAVSVETEEVRGEEGNFRRVSFIIDEGPRSPVRSVQIEGNETLKRREILNAMRTRPKGFFRSGYLVQDVLGEDLVAIEALYRANGFLDARIEQEVKRIGEGDEVSVRVSIRENRRTIVSSVNITGSAALKKKEVKRAIRMKKGKPFRTYLLRSDEDALSSLITEKGYPHVQVKGDFSLSEGGSKASVVYVIDEGRFVTMGKAFFNGNFRTKEKILKRELELKPGEPFSLSKVQKEQQNLRNMRILDSVKFVQVGLKEDRDKVHLLIDVEEKKPYFVEVGGGYETGIGVFGNAKVGDTNLLGRNKSAWIGGDVSQIGFRAETGILDPRLFGSRTETNLSAYVERKTELNQPFGLEKIGASLGFGWGSGRPLSSGLNLLYERRRQFVPGSREEVPGVTEPRSVFVATPGLVLDRRDSFLYPNKGSYSFFSVDFSKGVENSFDDFLKFRVEQRFYLTPVRPLTFAFTGRLGYIFPYGPFGKVPDDQLFYLGGTGDVRGFEENLLFFDDAGNPVGGRLSLSGSVEARIGLGRRLEVPLFLDTGYLADDFSGFSLGHFRSSAGVGIRYKSPIGPIGLMYGRNLSPRAGESTGKLHFSIGYTF